MNKLVNKFVS